jgi:hypothetical protein
LPELLAPEQQALLSAHPGPRNVAETMSGFEVIGATIVGAKLPLRLHVNHVPCEQQDAT